MNQNTRLQKTRLRRLNIRLSQQEWDKVHKLSSGTTCRSVSEYARKVLSEKPVKVFYRNQSFDDFEERMIRLMPILQEYGDKFDQLNQTLPNPESIPEIRLNITALFSAQQNFLKTAETIKEHIIKLADHASQNSPL